VIRHLPPASVESLRSVKVRRNRMQALVHSMQGRFERWGRGRYGGIRYGFRRARSRLYRNQILQVNTRWKALAEIYTMHSFAPFSNLNFFVKNAESFADFLNRILQNLPDFC